MANFSDLTRKEQVLARLKAADGGWVDGPELATEEVGGSEGLRRLRELVEDGHNVRKRKHPNTERDIWQYRIAPRILTLDGEVITPAVAAQQQLVSQMAIDPAEKPEYPKHEPQERMSTAVKRKEDGTYEYVPPQRPIIETQLTALAEEPAVEGRKFEALPRRIDWGSVAVCPRCRSKTTRGRDPKEVDESALTPQQRRQRERKKTKVSMIDEDGVKLFKDPYTKPTQPCTRCNGYGIVPNVGPIPLTMP